MHALDRRRVRVHDGWCLPHGAVDWNHGHVRVRGDDNWRCMRLKLTRWHHILRLRLRVWVPLRHLLHVLGIAIGGPVVLGVVVLRIRVVVHRRMGLGRNMVVVLMLLPPALVHGTRRRAMRTWHHGEQAAMLPLQSVAGQTDQAANSEATKGAERRRAAQSP
jgi:hypothetical protein